MSHIVYVTNGMSSTLNSSLELSRRLVERGHVVTYVSHAEIGSIVTAHGYPFHRLTRDAEFMERAAAARIGAGDMGRGPLGVLRWIRLRRRLRRESGRMGEFEALLGALTPDLVIVDYELHAAIVTCASLEIPMALAIVWFTIFRSPELPPLEFRSAPPVDARGRVAMRLLWLRSHLEGRWLEWKRQWSVEGLRIRLSPIPCDTLYIENVRAVAKERGFDLRRAKRTDWLRPLTYPEFPTLCFNLREMDFPHEPHRAMHYVGPMIARDRIEVRSAGTAEGEWDRFRESRSTTEGTRPLLYCSLGSHWSVDQGFLRKVLDVFVRRPGWDLVLGLGSKLDPEAMGPVPENALVLSWAPQLEILAVADGAITHGGITTINECIAYSVPMLVYSTEHVDQNGCAARIEYHGLGVVGDKNGDSPHDIERNIERLLSDSTIRENVSAMNRRLTEVERSGVAVSTVESLVGLGATAR